MRAGELAVGVPTVLAGADALEAARMLARERLPGLIVVGADGRPRAVLSGAQVLAMMVPRYMRDDPNLARVWDEGHADRLSARLDGKSVEDLLPDDVTPLPIVDDRATAVEIASVMAETRSSVVAVLDAADDMVGVVTASQLLDRLLVQE